MPSNSESVDLSNDGPTTRSKLKKPRKDKEHGLKDSSDENKKKKCGKRKKTLDDKSDGSEHADGSTKYVIDGDSLKKKFKTKYYDEFGIEDDIKEMKDITFNKNRYTVVKIGNKPRNYRTRNVDICVTCDEPGDDLILCVRCPAAFHSNCIAGSLSAVKIPNEPWYCRRCRNEAKYVSKPRRIPKALPFDEDSRYKSTLEDCLRKEKDDMTFEKALDMVALLANPRLHVLPKGLPDTLIDMPYMEHIPRKMACNPDSLCYACNQNPSDSLPAIECDYCFSTWHLHCLEIPMTVVMNEFWMCPLHGEIAIDEHVLTDAGISKRMFYWNRCRSKIKPKKVIKSFMNKVKEYTASQESEEEKFGDVPISVDSNNVEISNIAYEQNREHVPNHLTQPVDSLFDFGGGKIEILKQAAEYFEKAPSRKELLKEYYINRQEFLSDFVFSNISKAEFLNLTSQKIDELPNPSDFDNQGCYYNESNPTEMVKEHDNYSIEDLKSKKILFSSDGTEISNTGLHFCPVNKLYYPDDCSEYESDNDESSMSDIVYDEIKTFFPFLLDIDMVNNDIEIQNTEEKPVDTIVDNAQCVRSYPNKLTVHDFGNLYNGQLAFPSKVYYFVRYYATYFTNANKIVVIYKKSGEESQLKLPKYVPQKILSFAPETFTEEYDIDELQQQTNVLDSSFTRKTLNSVEMSELICLMQEILMKHDFKNTSKAYAIKVLKKMGCKFFISENEEVCLQLPLLNETSTADNIYEFLKEKMYGIFNVLKKKNDIQAKNEKEDNDSITKSPIALRKKRRINVDYKNNGKSSKSRRSINSIDDKRKLRRKRERIEAGLLPNHRNLNLENTSSLLIRDTSEFDDIHTLKQNTLSYSASEDDRRKHKEFDEKIVLNYSNTLETSNNVNDQSINFIGDITSGIEKELEESDESKPSSVETTQFETEVVYEKLEEMAEQNDSEAEREYSEPSFRKRTWENTFSGNDFDLNNINMNSIELDSLIPERQREIDDVDKDTKNYLVETPEFRRYLRKANAELTNIRKLVLQLKKTLGHDCISQTPSRRGGKRKKCGAQRKQPSKPMKDTLFESLSPKELLSQILESRRKYENIVREHREEGQAKKKQSNDDDDGKISFFDSLDGPRQTRARNTCLNENVIVKAAFQFPHQSSSGSSRSTERFAEEKVKRSLSLQDETKSTTARPPPAIKSRRSESLRNSSKPKQVSINEAATVTHEMSPTICSMETSHDLINKSSPTNFIMRAQDDDGSYKFYKIKLPDGSKFCDDVKNAMNNNEEAINENKKDENVKKVKDVTIQKQVKNDVGKNNDHEREQDNLVEGSSDSQIMMSTTKKEKTRSKKSNFVNSLEYSEKTFAKRKMIEMLPETNLETKDYDFSKMLKLECRKFGDFFYLVYQNKNKWIIVSRIPVINDVLAFETPYDVLEDIRTNEYLINAPGEEHPVDYNELTDEVIRHEKLCFFGLPKWRKNAGLADLVSKITDINMDADYTLDKRFLRSDLPVIGALALMKPAHSFAAIPLHYPVTTFGSSKRCLIHLPLLSNCNYFGKEHTTIYFDKMAFKTYLLPSTDVATIVDGIVYGGNIYRKNKCKCSYLYNKDLGKRPNRIVISDNSVIQMGCLKFTVMLMSVEQIWAEIPSTCPRIAPKDSGIPTLPNVHDNSNLKDNADLDGDWSVDSDEGF